MGDQEDILNRQDIQHSQAWKHVERNSGWVGEAIDWYNWPTWIVFALCIGISVAQVFISIPPADYGFSARALSEGRHHTWFTSLFLHAGLGHLIANMGAYLIVAASVRARFGRGIAAFIPFHVFYILCGLAGNVLFLIFHPTGEIPLVGASGAIYGLFGAVYRFDFESDRLQGVFSPRARLGWRWLVISNLIIVSILGVPLLLIHMLAEQTEVFWMPIAWEAHVGGFVAGILLIGLMGNKGWRDERVMMSALNVSESNT